jgi:hypothetical protein
MQFSHTTFNWVLGYTCEDKFWYPLFKQFTHL